MHISDEAPTRSIKKSFLHGTVLTVTPYPTTKTKKMSRWAIAASRTDEHRLCVIRAYYTKSLGIYLFSFSVSCGLSVINGSRAILLLISTQYLYVCCLCLCVCLYIYIYIYILSLKFYVPVGCLVRSFVCPDFHAPTDRRIVTVHMSKEMSRPRNEPLGGYFRIRPHPGTKGGRRSPLFPVKSSGTSDFDEN